MSVPENECPHLDTRTILTYNWSTRCCIECGAEWRIPTTTPPPDLTKGGQ